MFELQIIDVFYVQLLDERFFIDKSIVDNVHIIIDNQSNMSQLIHMLFYIAAS